MKTKGKTKTLVIKTLKLAYIGVFILSIGLISAMHILPDPYLEAFRIPEYLREVGPVIGLSWPVQLNVYHIFLLLFIGIVLSNAMSLHRLSAPKWQTVLRISSFLGIFLAWSIFSYFVFPLTLRDSFTLTNIQTSFIYAFFSFSFLILDLITFVVAET